MHADTSTSCWAYAATTSVDAAVSVDIQQGELIRLLVFCSPITGTQLYNRIIVVMDRSKTPLRCNVHDFVARLKGELIRTGWPKFEDCRLRVVCNT